MIWAGLDPSEWSGEPCFAPCCYCSVLSAKLEQVESSLEISLLLNGV